MHPLRRLGFAGFLALTFSLQLAPQNAFAGPSGVKAVDAWARWLPNDLPAAGYLTLVNDSDEDAFLTGAKSEDYTMVHLHESYTAPDGTSGMRPVEKVRVPAHGRASLAPGGFHLMLMKARRPIEPGDTVTLVLKFEGGGELEVKVPVKPADYKP